MVSELTEEINGKQENTGRRKKGGKAKQKMGVLLCSRLASVVSGLVWLHTFGATGDAAVVRAQ
jgi:hypothetical protein